MRLTIERDILAIALARVSSVVKSGNVIPILSTVKLVAENGTLTITGTNMDMSVQQVASAMITEPGTVCLPADKLSALTNSLPKGSQIEIEAQGLKATVKHGRGKVSFSCLDHRDFPAHKIVDAGIVTIASADFRRIITMAEPFISDDKSRHYLNGIFLSGDGDRLRAVATDGNGLVVASMTCEAKTPGIIIPDTACAAMLKILSGADGELSLAASETGLQITIGQCSFTTKLVDGTFPEYQRVVPQPQKNPLIFAADEFREVATRAQTVVEGITNKAHRMTLTPSDGELRIEAGSDADQKLDETIAIEGKGPIFGLATRYALMGIAAFGDAGQLELHMESASSALLMRRPGNDREFAVLMPMRL